jgi:hypothetical protein
MVVLKTDIQINKTKHTLVNIGTVPIYNFMLGCVNKRKR